MAWLSGWKKRISLTVSPSGKVDSEQSDFPVRVYLSASSGISSKDVSQIFDEIGSDANRKKIAVTISDGVTQCYVEIDIWDNAGEEAELWVKIPTLLSSGDTVIYLYYDSSQADNTTYVGDTGSTPAQTVWDANFKAVYHMSQDPSGGAPQMLDSTSNSNDGTSAGSMTSGDLVDGPIGKALDLDGSDDRIASSSSDFEITSGTLEVIYNPSDNELSTHEAIMAKWDNSPAKGFRLLRTNTDEYLRLMVADGSSLDDLIGLTKVSNVSTNIAATFKPTGLELFIEGVSDNSSVISRTVSYGSSTFHIGMNVAEWFSKGIMDEVRISDIVRSDAWLKATKYSNDDNLITYGDEVTMIKSSLNQRYALDGVILLKSSLKQRYALDGVTLILSSFKQAYSLYGAPVASLDLVDVYYELYVGTELVPFSSLRGTKRNAGQDSIYLVIPNGRAWIDAVTAQAGQDLVVKRGGRLRSDLSDVAPAEFIRATFETSAYDEGSRSSSITLMGFRDIEAPGTPKGVEMKDISYLAIGTDGRRRVRGRMDDTLVYGDQVTLHDGTFFTVGEIGYTIAQGRFQMEVKEQ